MTGIRNGMGRISHAHGSTTHALRVEMNAESYRRDASNSWRSEPALNNPLDAKPEEIWHYQRYKQFRNPKAARLTAKLSTAGRLSHADRHISTLRTRDHCLRPRA